MGKHDINAFLGAGTSFAGRLCFEGVVRIDGVFDGEIASAGTLIIGKNARVSGRLEVGRLECGGVVAAEVLADSMVTVRATGSLTGSVRAPALVLEEGGLLDGEVAMGGPDGSGLCAGGVPAALSRGGDDKEDG